MDVVVINSNSIV